MKTARHISTPNKITPQLAEILGRHAGDGTLVRRTYTMKIVTANKEFAETCRKDFEEAFGIKPKILKYKNTLEIKINSMELMNYFNKVFQMPIGKKSDIVSEPLLIKESNMDCRTAFLRGVIDTDGSVYLNRQGKPHIEISSNSKQLISDCKEIMDLHEIKSSIYTRNRNDKTSYVLRTHVKDTSFFLEKIGLKNPEKLKHFAGPETG